MRTEKGNKMAVDLERSTTSIVPSSNLQRRWIIITTLILATVFIQACLAGAMLSGVDGARTAHTATAAALIVATIAAGLVSVATLRRIPRGTKLGLTLLSLAAVFCIQAATGVLSAMGRNLLWVHVPLGIAVFGVAVLAVAGARRLGSR
jgi:hypothetical protein